VHNESGLNHRKKAENAKRRRNPRPEAKRLLQEPEESRHALVEPSLNEVASRTAPVHPRGGCAATRIHLGRLANAS
jgi:hypothetical protein